MNKFLSLILILFFTTSTLHAKVIVSEAKVHQFFKESKILSLCKITKFMGGFWEFVLVNDMGTYVNVKPFRRWDESKSEILIVIGSAQKNGKLAEGFAANCPHESALEHSVLQVLDNSLKADIGELQQSRLSVLRGLIVDRTSFPPDIRLSGDYGLQETYPSSISKFVERSTDPIIESRPKSMKK